MKFTPKIGMYVWCPYSSAGEATVHLYGQIDLISGDRVRVHFHDLYRNQNYLKQYNERAYVSIQEIRRAPALNGAAVQYGELNAEILPTSQFIEEENELYLYTIEIIKDGASTTTAVYEDQLRIPLTCGKQNPLQQLLEQEETNPEMYYQRRIISESQANTRNAPAGFKSLLGTRAGLYSHQIDSIVRAFSEQPFRLMLADEVGLGKTIEAGAILKGMREFNPETRATIIVPDALSEQWLAELQDRFFIKARIWVPGTQAHPGQQVYVLPFSLVTKCYTAIRSGRACSSLLIVDEAHKLLNRAEDYKAIYTLSSIAQNVLLLSATPVLRHSKENLMLLTLLDPARYRNISVEQFQKAVNSQAIIRENVFSMVRDLPDYAEYDLKEEYIEKLEEIQREIQDSKLQSVISDLRQQNNKELCLSSIKTCLAYLSEYHRIDQNIIRHRKNEIPDAQAPRMLIDLAYTPAGLAEGFYEQECLDAANDVFQTVFFFFCGAEIIKICKKLFQATTSSPHAVLGIIKNRTDNMGEPFDRFFTLIDRWKEAYDREIGNISELEEHPSAFHSKVARLIQWIQQEDPEAKKKFLVFSEYRQTAELYHQALTQYYGKDSACMFCKGMDAPQRKRSVQAFQNTSAMRFLVCDASGGEGRNFQIADYIVHCDLSWSPAVMEQRIGRLDRIGRTEDHPVYSVALHADLGAENDLFTLYNEGLKVFTHSLCGMEIAFDEIQQQIDSAFVENPDSGLRSILPKIADYAEQMEQEVEQERYFDMARQLDADTTEQLDKLVHFFSHEEGSSASEAMIEWLTNLGLPAKRKLMELDNTSYLSIDFDQRNQKIMRAQRYALPFWPDHPKMRCTFSRKAAVAHEWLYFLAPSNALYESIANHAIQDSKSSTAILHYSDCEISWEGFLFIWNVYYDYSQIIQKNLPPASLSMLNRFLPIGQIPIFVSLSTLQAETDPDILNQLHSLAFQNPPPAQEVQHDEEWRDALFLCERNGLVAAKAKHQELLRTDQARAFFESMLAASSAQRLHGGKRSANNWIQTENDIEFYLYGMENPILELDSAAYITTEQVQTYE